MVKNPPANAEDTGLIPGLGSPPGGGNGNTHQYSCLEEEMATRTSILAWEIPWSGDPGWLQSNGVVKSDRVTEHTHTLLKTTGKYI